MSDYNEPEYREVQLTPEQLDLFNSLNSYKQTIAKRLMWQISTAQEDAHAEDLWQLLEALFDGERYARKQEEGKHGLAGI